MNTNVRALLILAASMAASGCVGVSMHSLRPVRIAVTDATSSLPAGGIPLTVTYDYDSYGLFYLFNRPQDQTAVTNQEGVAVMPLADFRFRILLKVGVAAAASLDKDLVVRGGTISSPPYKLLLNPA